MPFEGKSLRDFANVILKLQYAVRNAGCIQWKIVLLYVKEFIL